MDGLMKECSIEGCTNRVWSKGMCKNHIPKESIRTNKIKTVRTEANPMHVFFKQIWKERKHYSELSGTYLGDEAMSTFFHHILPKEKYPELAYEESNIILLTLDEHTNVENDIYKYEEVNKRRESLKLKYERT
jgi:hypothetical protein